MFLWSILQRLILRLAWMQVTPFYLFLVKRMLTNLPDFGCSHACTFCVQLDRTDLCMLEAASDILWGANLHPVTKRISSRLTGWFTWLLWWSGGRVTSMCIFQWLYPRLAHYILGWPQIKFSYLLLKNCIIVFGRHLKMLPLTWLIAAALPAGHEL